MIYLCCYFLLVLGAWTVGEVKTLEEPADSVWAISELVLIVSEIGTETDDDLDKENSKVLNVDIYDEKKTG